MVHQLLIWLWRVTVLVFSFSLIQVEFVVQDVTTAEYEPESFDVIYSRDTILHIEDKKSLFANFLVS